MIELFVILYGLAFGSFYNVCIYRIPRGESLYKSSSHCPCCGHKLTYLDLFPLLSFFMLLGRCRYCKVKIPIIYPVVEAATSLIFYLSFQHYKFTQNFFIETLLMSLFIVFFPIGLVKIKIHRRLIILFTGMVMALYFCQKIYLLYI